MNLAYQYAERNGRKGFSKLTRQAGRVWLKGFLKGHPEIRIKKAHNLSVNRAICANKLTVEKFFNLYEMIIKDYHIESPMKKWNCDESSVQDVPKEQEMLGVTGEKTSNVTSKEQGETSTILTFANACRQGFPPVVIHKGGSVSNKWKQGAPWNVTIRASPKGWINKEIFYEYTVSWVTYLKATGHLDKPHLLLYDAHESHIYNLDFLKLMVANKIEVLAMPWHTSHVLQPLDSTTLANFKTNWNNNLTDYLFHNVGCTMPKQDFWIPFWPAWHKSMTVVAVQSGFRKTGTFPINHKMIKQSGLGLSAVTDNVQNIQGRMCSELVNYVCVIISRLLLGEFGQLGVGSCCLAAISVLFQLLHFCLVITT